MVSCESNHGSHIIMLWWVEFASTAFPSSHVRKLIISLHLHPRKSFLESPMEFLDLYASAFEAKVGLFVALCLVQCLVCSVKQLHSYFQLCYVSFKMPVHIYLRRATKVCVECISITTGLFWWELAKPRETPHYKHVASSGAPKRSLHPTLPS